MTARTSPSPRWLRPAAIGLGILLLLWLPVEDQDPRWAVLFAIAISAMLAARFLNPSAPPQRPYSKGKPWMRPPLYLDAVIGALTGLAVPLLAAFLMIFKNGLHGHPTPDFTPSQVMAVVSRTPFFFAAGLLIGFGTRLYRVARR